MIHRTASFSYLFIGAAHPKEILGLEYYHLVHCLQEVLLAIAFRWKHKTLHCVDCSYSYVGNRRSCRSGGIFLSCEWSAGPVLKGIQHLSKRPHRKSFGGSEMTRNHSSMIGKWHFMCSLSSFGAALSQVQERWNQDLTAIEESIRLMLGNRLQEAEDGLWQMSEYSLTCIILFPVAHLESQSDIELPRHRSNYWQKTSVP